MNKSRITMNLFFKRIFFFLLIVFLHDVFTKQFEPEILFPIQVIPNAGRGSGYSPQKICFRNSRIILGAVENYNYEHTVMMEDLDLDLLYAENYLKKESLESVKDDRECYYTCHNLTEMGNDNMISCSVHGSEYEQNKNREADYAKKKRNNVIKLIIITLVALFIPGKWLTKFL